MPTKIFSECHIFASDLPVPGATFKLKEELYCTSHKILDTEGRLTGISCYKTDDPSSVFIVHPLAIVNIICSTEESYEALVKTKEKNFNDTVERFNRMKGDFSK